MPAFSSVPEEAFFLARAPQVDLLLSRYPILRERLQGSFVDRPVINNQNGCKMISWELDQGKTANPRLIRMSPGKYNFRTTHHEAIIVLEGGEDCISTEGIPLSQGHCIPLPSDSNIEMNVNRAVLVWKQFKPVTEMGRAFIVTVTPEALQGMQSRQEDFHDLIVGTLHEKLCHQRGDYLTFKLFGNLNPDNIVASLEKLNHKSPVAILAIQDPEQIELLQSLCAFAGVRYNATKLTIC